MLGEIGTFFVGLALAISLYAAFAACGFVAGKGERLDEGRREASPWWQSAHNAVNAAAVLLGVALLALAVAFIGNRFEMQYVAQHSSRALPLYLKLSAVWAGQEGSLLLWSFLQALFTALAIGFPTERSRPLVPWAAVFLALITAFFVAATLWLSNPFVQSAAIPFDGVGLNPLLRHPGMIFHPPALYVGYVGLAVPFAFALSALATGDVKDWTTAVRSWMLAAWLGLGLGLLLGMRWAYDVLGWGGYWGWDPVENAGLMPWLTATAMLHASVMQEEKRGFRVWTVVLAIFSFVLVLFGAYATRSGAIQSVHAYARSNLGGYFIGAIGVTLVGSLALVTWRWQLLREDQSIEELLPREGVFFLTLILFSMLTVSVFIGSVLPALTALLAHRRFEAGPAWFDRVTGPQFGALVLLIGLCPLLGRAATVLRSRRRWWLPAVGAVAATGAAVLAGFTLPVSLVGFAVVGLAGAATLVEFVEGVTARRRRTGDAPLNALWQLFRLQQRKYGGYLVHVGVMLMALGVIGTRMYPFERQLVLSIGQPAAVGDYTLSLEDRNLDMFDDHVSMGASVSIYRQGRYLATLKPQLNRYVNFDQAIPVPALHSGIREDFYLILVGWLGDGATVTMKVVVNALANFLWLGGLILIAGGMLAFWPKTRQKTVVTPTLTPTSQTGSGGCNPDAGD